ncbi:secreted RxLR effector protein [Trifolium repens]|nr:secreted RxLR effector protein [Trifolium repens]
MDKEGGFVNRPPMLTGSNYDHWKPKMIAFLKSIDSRTWKAVLKGWDHPLVMTKEGTSTGELKPEADWTKEEDEAALSNNKAVNALFNGVDENMFKLIKKCLSAKEAWEILMTRYEGTSKVKMSKLQILTTKFESLRMKEEESIQDFHMSLVDIANAFEALGEKVSDEKLSRKMLRSLPKRFDMKVTAIEEAQDIANMKVDELVGSLQTFELTLNERGDKKSKSVAFISNDDEEESQTAVEEDENISDALALIGKQFGRVLRRVDRRARQNGQNIRFDINKQQNIVRKTRPGEKIEPVKEVQCHECEGYGHVRTECGTFLKKQKKGMFVSWTDEDSEEGEESARHVSAMTGVCDTVDDSDDDVEVVYEEHSEDEENDTYEELLGLYNDLLVRYKEVCRILEKQKKTINQLHTEKDFQIGQVLKVEKELTQANADMEELKKRVNQLNCGANLLEEILDGVPSTRMKAIGYNYTALNQHQQDKDTKFLPADEVINPYTGEKMLQPPAPHPKTYPYFKLGQGPRTFANRRRAPGHHGHSRKWVCHHCGMKGHIRPFCYKLYGYPRHWQQPKTAPREEPVRKVWQPKAENKGLIAHTSLRASSREDWYFDSGCSRHMTGVETYLKDLKGYASSSVTFGDGAKGEILGIGKLVNKELPNLENVLLVKGLTANLISISQLCDQGLKVNFTKEEYLVSNDQGEILMKGGRSKDNCYLWVSHEEAQLGKCLLGKEDEVQLWHQKLGHLSLSGMKKVVAAEAIRGLPKLKITEGSICGKCQIGKQTRMSHPMLEHQVTSRTLELLHMDLMGPMQVESLGGRRYAFVVVDDFSRYTWVNFIRDKSDSFDIFKTLSTQVQREKNCGIVRIRSVYRSMIGNLLYLTASRPDITFAVGVCARYQSEPKVSHLNQVKRILKYVNGTCDYGMMYSHCEDSKLSGYCDADWAGSADDRKSTSGGCFFLGSNLISWFSKKQNCVALSTAEAEYVAAGSSCTQLVWMKQMLKEYDVEQDVITLYCDNLSAINISKNPVQHSKTKHIDIRHHFIRDLVENKVVTLEHVGTKDQVADIFTKALDAVQFENLRGKLGICLFEDL